VACNILEAETKHYEKDKNFGVVVGKQRQGLLLVGPTIYDGVHILHTLSFFPSLNHIDSKK
jgi:hypothetical protein